MKGVMTPVTGWRRDVAANDRFAPGATEEFHWEQVVVILNAESIEFQSQSDSFLEIQLVRQEC